MPKTGEPAPKTTGYVCTKCGHVLHLREGQTIPPCANCGNSTFRLE